MIETPPGHKSGFANIMGAPNVGKSTLMNSLLGEKMSIITSKPQTTRHRILGIYNDDLHQIVFSDTPGIISDPAYSMHESMNDFAFSVLKDADILLCMTDLYEKDIEGHFLIQKSQTLDVPVALLINKSDQAEPEQLNQLVKVWEDAGQFDEIFTLSALKGTGVDEVLQWIKNHLPEGPPYFPKDQLTDRTERFFVSEIIREKIFLHYRKEIPYSCEVVVHEYKEDDDRDPPFARISAYIFVERDSQKNIIIGKGGEGIKKIGIEARKDIQDFVQREIFLDLRVKVRRNWRNDPNQLKNLGYRQS